MYSELFGRERDNILLSRIKFYNANSTRERARCYEMTDKNSTIIEIYKLIITH